MLSWNRAAVVSGAPPWATWGVLFLQRETLRGSERVRALQQMLKQCQRLVRELPADPWSHYHLGICYAAFDDLSALENAARSLEKAAFIAPDHCDTLVALARAYQKLGRPAKVDAIRQRMLLLEPELPVP